MKSKGYFGFLLNITLIALLVSGCSLFKTERVALIPEEPKLDYKKREIIEQQAQINYNLASKINEVGAEPRSIETLTLKDGTYVILSYIGHPAKDISLEDPKALTKVLDKSKEIVQDYNTKLAKYDDTLDKKRDNQVDKLNEKWDWGRIIGFFTSTTFLVIVGLLVASIFFPVLIPVIQILFQLVSAGFGAFTLFAKLGISGITNLIKGIESFRDNANNAAAKQALDTHLSKVLDSKEKDAIDALKNHFSI